MGQRLALRGVGNDAFPPSGLGLGYVPNLQYGPYLLAFTVVQILLLQNNAAPRCSFC